MAKQRNSEPNPVQCSKKKPREFPVEIWAGGSLIRILRDPLYIPIKPPGGKALKEPGSNGQNPGQDINQSKGEPAQEAPRKKYDSYLVEYCIGSERIRKRRGSFEDASALADGIRVKLLNNDVEATKLVGRDQQIYTGALEHVRELDTTLDHIAKEYMDLVKILRPHSLTLPAAVHLLDSTLKRVNGTPLSTVVEFFELHGRAVKEKKTVPEVLKEMLQDLRQDKVGAYHVRDLELRAGYFAEAFTGLILGVTTAQIDHWLCALKSRSKKQEGQELSGTTRNNYRDAVVQLFNFARKKRYLSPDLSTAAEDAKVVNEVTAENEIFTPEEMQKLLADATAHLIPGLVVKAFSGVRTEEVIKIEWSAIKFDQNCIILPKGITKLDQRRVIPLKPNLKAWLLPFCGAEGRVCEGWTIPNSVAHAWKRHGESVGVEVGKNKFRNSYISYRVAESMDPKTVAFESGNSEATIRRDYLEVTTPLEAEKWFSIFPPDQPEKGGEAKRKA